ncbi:outer membrane receptor for ferrienterochelin and colicins [Mariniphaga anaerophila]|uniref:Outer membrane receptor for ferrienterochelin and colicins n=1 Tax=Mariniphaga anaerophila TaxID=1484053 RepID=A0A1M4SLY9_9BACT|nr:TonB-dependent receptor [Mariniphaga anaerophila]SHE33168.1 outer membrane receptor for ferrienterochelin and colicins [Mariniphaga anaerophila]
MRLSIITTIILSFLSALVVHAQNTDAVIIGHVVSRGEHLPFVNVYLEGTKHGTTTDVTGHYMMVDLPEGEYTLVAKMIGYKTEKRPVVLEAGETMEVKFELEEEVLRVGEVVVTGTKTFKRQTESAVIVNVLDAKTIKNVAAQTVSQTLNFQPGLRMEVDCQTCNYSQLRMNGLGGAYSQILINSRAVFSPLTGLYGLEQLPSEMVERIEVVRGGASALYGSSAIGGTVNIITKMPGRNSYEITSNNSVLGNGAADYNVNGTLTALSQKRNAGVALYTSYRQRDSYDHNGDNYSELPTLNNNSFGMNSFFKLDEKQQLQVNFSSMHEYRYGGEIQDGPAYMAQQSEERTHNVLMGGVDYELTSDNNRTSLVLYTAGQHTKRKHYTGLTPDTESDLQKHNANPPYGNSKNYTIQFGAQLNHVVPEFIKGRNTLTFGTEYVIDDVFDEIEAYQYMLDQNSKNFGAFFQSDWEITRKTNLLAGVRADKHNFVDDLILNPRVSLLFKPDINTQLRLSWSTGFRAPQAFDADMHIAFAGGGIQTISLADDLKEERSQSMSASINWDKPTEKHIFGFTLEGFYTRLKDAFILEEIGTDDSGNSLMEKRNGGMSNVYGTTLEARANYNRTFQIEGGFTLQKSLYDQPVAWSDQIEGTKKYLRTPQAYGYYTLTFTPMDRLSASLSGIYTGSMLIPHYGVPEDAGTPEQDLLFESPDFMEMNLKLGYTFKVNRLDSSIELYGGVSNLLDSYQNDFDSGKNRDSNYIYGPAQPRSYFFGIRIFN